MVTNLNWRRSSTGLSAERNQLLKPNDAADGRPRRPLFPPRRKRVVERALAGGALFDRDDGAALVDIDQRHVEPRTLLQELQVARAVGVDVGEADQEEAVGDFHRKPRQRRAARLLV